MAACLVASGCGETGVTSEEKSAEITRVATDGMERNDPTGLAYPDGKWSSNRTAFDSSSVLTLTFNGTSRYSAEIVADGVIVEMGAGTLVKDETGHVGQMDKVTPAGGHLEDMTVWRIMAMEDRMMMTTESQKQIALEPITQQ